MSMELIDTTTVTRCNSCEFKRTRMRVSCLSCKYAYMPSSEEYKTKEDLYVKRAVKGKVVDEPEEWVQGYLIRDNCIFQEKKHKGSKCCGIGIFQIIPGTITPVKEETEGT